MNLKNILAIVIAIVIIILVVWWFSSQKEATPTDEISVLFGDLKTETGIDFSDIEDVEFIWQTKDGEIPIQGKGFKAKGILNEDEQGVESFFKDNGFEVDVYNIAAGTIGWLTGYRKDRIVCIVLGSLWLDDEGMPLQTGEMDIEVQCGESEESLEPLFTTEESIKELFAGKYNKKVSAVSLDITKETEDYARGSVTFLDEGPLGIGGIFLATKIDGEWMLVFDGNGSFSCEMLRDYNFPEDMMEGCAEEMEPMLDIKDGSEFFIVLKSNPTTGFQWDFDSDSDFLELVEQKYVPDSTDPMLVGGGGKDYFKFKALKSGITEITFSYLRPWEGEESIIEERIYQIGIE